MTRDNQACVCDTECENRVLGALLTYPQLCNSVRSSLAEDCFYNDKNKAVYKACVSVADQGRPVDLVTVMGELRQEGCTVGRDYLIDLLAYDVCGPVQVETYALRLRDLASRRKLWEIGQSLLRCGIDETEDITTTQQQVLEGIECTLASNDGVCTLVEAYKSLTAIMSRNASGGGLSGTATGFKKFDAKGGLQKSDLVIIAGETSQGKSSFALTICKRAIEQSKVAFYSMEMTKEQLAARIISAGCNVSASDILYNGRLDSGQRRDIETAAEQMNGGNLFFDDRSTSNIDTILVSIRMMKQRNGIEGVVVDYLQILNVNMRNTNKEQAMADVARRLKNIAKELGIWVIAVSQLSRNQDPVPTLSRLRDSGQIAEAADVVMLVYRPEYYGKKFPEPFADTPTEGMAMIDVAKGRNIGVFKFLARFNKESASFSDYIQTSADDPLGLGPDYECEVPY